MVLALRQKVPRAPAVAGGARPRRQAAPEETATVKNQSVSGLMPL